MNVQIFPNLQNPPIFHSEERLVNVERGRECFCLSIFIISLWFKCFNILDAETLTGGLEKAKYSKDVTKILQRCHQNLTFFSTQKYILVLLQSNFFSFNNYLLKRPKVNTHLDRVVFTIIINFQKSKTFIIIYQENLASFSWHIMNVLFFWMFIIMKFKQW